MNSDNIIVIEGGINPSTVRDAFKSREEIENFLSERKVGEIDAGAGAHLMWEFANEETPSTGVVDRLFKDVSRSTDAGISTNEQYDVDAYMDRIFEIQHGLTEVRAQDTGIMKVVNERVLELCQTHMITDAADLRIEFHPKSS